MEQRIHRGALSGREEFFYPDMPVGHLPQGLRLAMPRNGRPGVQLLLKTDAGQLDASLESDAFVPEFFCMKAVPVEYNTCLLYTSQPGMTVEPEKAALKVPLKKRPG